MIKEIRSILKSRFGKATIKDILALRYICKTRGVSPNQIMNIVRMENGDLGVLYSRRVLK